MEIRYVGFESPMTLIFGNERVIVTVFKTQEAGNIKFGIKASANIAVDREEIALRKKKQPSLINQVTSVAS